VIQERERGLERESAPRASVGQKDALRVVGDKFPADPFVIGEMLRSERRADVHDRDIRSFGQAGNKGYLEINESPEW
jgi:hypothetical protein